MNTSDPRPKSTAVPLSVDNHVLLWRSRGGFAEAWRWRASGWLGASPLLHALALALLVLLPLSGCGIGSQQSASDGTTAASASTCTDDPVLTQTPTGVLVSYCGNTTFLSAEQIARQAIQGVR